MQKISRKSLAVVALSVLLAISMALTFTFAALNAEQRTATGTITFAGGLTITLAPGEGVNGTNGITIASSGQDLTITITDAAFEYSTDKFVLTAAAKADLAKATVTITSATEKTFYWDAALTDTAGETSTVKAGAEIGNDKESTDGAEVSKTLADFISDIEITGAVSTDNTFTVTFNADYAA